MRAHAQVVALLGEDDVLSLSITSFQALVRVANQFSGLTPALG